MSKPKVNVAADLLHDWAQQLVQEELPGLYQVDDDGEFVNITIAGQDLFKVSPACDADDWQPRTFKVQVSVKEVK